MSKEEVYYNNFIPQKTPKDTYLNVIKNTQLVSVDLIVKYDNKILVGKRKNNPAKGYYFVPGSRVYKNETINQAVERVSWEELGCKFTISQFTFKGIHEHIYENNFDNDDFNTHYVAFSYEINLEYKPNNINFYEQHSESQWITKDEIINRGDVHIYTKTHFMNNPENRILQL